MKLPDEDYLLVTEEESFVSDIFTYKVENSLISDEQYQKFIEDFNNSFYPDFNITDESDMHICRWSTNERGYTDIYNLIVVYWGKNDGWFSFNNFINTHGDIEGFKVSDIVLNCDTLLIIYIKEDTKFLKPDGCPLDYERHFRPY